MKKWILFCWVILAVGLLIRIKPSSVDVETLEPVELLYVNRQNGTYYLTSDTGCKGSGQTVAQAISDLKAKSSGRIFLNTAEHLLLTSSAWESLERFFQHLRPDCSVLLVEGEPDMETAAQFLRTHKPGFTLNDFRAGARDVPLLYSGEGGMLLEKP